MTNLLLKLFTKNTSDRIGYGLLGGIVGIVCNVLLFAFKLGIGLISSSISIIADSINNLADALSSVITIIGFKLSSKPADDEHPFGHARIENIAGLIISIFIIFIGSQLVLSSIGKIITPVDFVYNKYAILILIISIFVKLWLYLFNRKLSYIIQSPALKATAKDSLNDAIVTTGILISIVVSDKINFNLDGYISFIVALFIIYVGTTLVKETVSPLLGEAPPDELVRQLETKISSYDGVLGVHKLTIHTYGPTNLFASVHIEVDANVDIVTSHKLADRIEKACLIDFDVNLVIHLDPI
ncbi:MAG: cation diffusion facilitator family transporter [Epulopiscium sp. Nele67-Bin004]|nr:MAG: cation diffusion facilitator family transporter [Epulopiscium sp. Nele67-Bin004]